MKSWNRSTLLTIFFVLAAWATTFFAAVSDCSVQEWINLECTEFAYPKKSEKVKSESATAKQSLATEALRTNSATASQAPKDPPSASELKGQFGDFFGVLNALFGALTLVTVYRAYRLQTDQVKDLEANATKQLQAMQFERYLIEVEAAISSYNRLVGAIVVPDGLNRWESVHGLFHLWKTYLILPAYLQADDYSGTYRNPNSASPRNNSLNLWTPLLKEQGGLTQEFDKEWSDIKWVGAQLDKLSDETKQIFIDGITANWRKMYAAHRYQLDAVFRSWYHVCLTIATARAFNVDKDAEWRIAGRFRAQLSSIELQFLLANQALSESPGFPKAIAMSERYAIFDNYVAGLDPTAIYILKTSKNTDQKMNPRSFNSDLAKAALI
jgi:hypothetical protein